MSAVARLERECAVFTRYLLSRDPTPYVRAEYARAHEVLRGLAPGDGHERWLLSAARAAPALCRVADAYARVAAPRSALRRKLVVMLAILEVTPPFAGIVERPLPGPPLVQLLRLVAAGVASVAGLMLGLVLFGPARLAARPKGA